MAESKSNTVKSSDGNAVTEYVRGVRGEVRRITWPSQPEAWRLTGIVLAVTVIMAIFLSLFDYGFSNLFRLLVDLYIGV